jgi:hypothetical protein
MRDGGKGDRRRKLVVSEEVFNSNWDAIFGKKELCESCNNNKAESLHTCPFSEEIYGDNQQCNCCDDCQNQCCQAI